MESISEYEGLDTYKKLIEDKLGTVLRKTNMDETELKDIIYAVPEMKDISGEWVRFADYGIRMRVFLNPSAWAIVYRDKETKKTNISSGKFSGKNFEKDLERIKKTGDLGIINQEKSKKEKK